jgi:hypothetical protein
MSLLLEGASLPFRANADRRHRIPKRKHRVTNSAAYDETLRRRGSLTVWFTGEAIAACRAEARTTRGGSQCEDGDEQRYPLVSAPMFYVSMSGHVALDS